MKKFVTLKCSSCKNKKKILKALCHSINFMSWITLSIFSPLIISCWMGKIYIFFILSVVYFEELKSLKGRYIDTEKNTKKIYTPVGKNYNSRILYGEILQSET